ncbi:MAG: hypothetical protein KAS66_13515, partial [Candidatus Omnitrophica bacterium]|nr:hypothetical protein [Candidatus Omnitrophota bacterium]
QVKSKMEYRSGTVDGIVKMYNESGELIQDAIWKNGKSPDWTTLVEKSQQHCPNDGTAPKNIS